MKPSKLLFLALAVILLVCLMVSSHPGPVAARPGENGGAGVEGFGTASVSPESQGFMRWSDQEPALSRDQISQLEYWSERTNLPGPARPSGDPQLQAGEISSGAGSLVESSAADLRPAASWLTRKTVFGSIIPYPYASNVMESSLGQHGQAIFFTGNWFAARSTDGGVSWKYVNPFADMPDFCCDQVSISDEARNAIFWLRMGRPDQFFENHFRLGVSKDGGASFCSYDITPKETNPAWSSQWWDYPHIQLGDNYMYLSWNMFNNQNQWTRTVMLRLPLVSLSACGEVDYDYVYTSSWFTFVPVQGAAKTMYFASNWALQLPNNRLGIWRWDESDQNPAFIERTIAAWNYTSRGEAICGALSGNWAARSDDRLLAGSIFRYQSLYPNRPVIGFWWGVKQGSAFPQPYIEGAAFFADTLTQVPGSQGRPLVYSKATCMLYPSTAADLAGHVAMVFHYGSGPNLSPAVGVTISDTLLGTPLGMFYFPVQASNARPADNKWGDYNTVRWIPSSPNTWSAGSHYITQAQDCINCSGPVFFTFIKGKLYQNFVPIIRR